VQPKLETACNACSEMLGKWETTRFCSPGIDGFAALEKVLAGTHGTL
jgi:hypothetical protein